MKVKGINPIEQHIEKIVLVLVALVLLVVLAMQFLTQPNTVDTGNRSVPPQNVYVELQRQAETLDSQLKDASPALPAVQTTDLVARYNQAFEQGSGGPERLTAALGQGFSVAAATGTDISGAGPSSDEVAVLTVPPTPAPVAGSQWGTLDPYALVAVPEYAAFVPEEQPYDFASVTIETTFSGTALRDALSPPAGAGVPRRFWQATGMGILGLEVERQRQNADGSWGSAEPITTPPGTPLPTRAITEEAGLPQLTELISKANNAAADVQRPMLPPTIAGPDWTPPSERSTDADSQLSEADRIRRNLERALADLERLQGTTTTTRDPGPRDRNPGSGRTPTTGPGTGTTGTTGTSPANQRRVEQLQRQIEEYRAQLTALGESAQTTASPTGARDTGTTAQASLNILEQQSVQLWAHDLGVEPGATYRYRTRVVLNNPLFRKGPVLNPDDETLQTAASQPFSRAAWSEWSEPVVVGAREYFFVTGADAEGSLTGGRANANIEVFRMHYGFYRKSILGLTAGDPIESSIRMPDGLFRIDTGVIEAQAASAAIFGEASASLPAGLTRLSGRLTIRPGVLVLDVASRPVAVTDNLGRSTTVSEVILRDADGQVLVRTGREDTARQAYQLANGSAAAASRSTLRELGLPALSPSAGLFEPEDAQP